MPLPKRKLSRSRRDKRRHQNKLAEPASSRCPQCNEVKLPHRVCPHCGYYKGSEVFSPKEA